MPKTDLEKREYQVLRAAAEKVKKIKASLESDHLARWQGWVDELTYGHEFHQISDQLGDGEGGRCCLGVACEVAKVAGVPMSITPATPSYPIGQQLFNSADASLPGDVIKWLGLPEGMDDPIVIFYDPRTGKRMFSTLSGLNDQYHFSFYQIGEIIAHNYLGAS